MGPTIFHLLLDSILIFREPTITPGLKSAQSEEKENEAPDYHFNEAFGGNGSENVINAGRLNVNESYASCVATNEYAGNTWEKYYKASLGEPVSTGGAGGGAVDGAAGQPEGEDVGGDKYSAIASLDDDQEEEKWSERTTVITALDHQVKEITKPIIKYVN